MLKARLFAIFLLTVMVLNIMRYQLPFIEYSILKAYIVKNLCEKRNETNNCCQGKCFLNKQIKKTEETENKGDTTNNNNKRIINIEVNDFLGADIAGLAPLEVSELLYPRSGIVHIKQIIPDVFVPPKQISTI